MEYYANPTSTQSVHDAMANGLLGFIDTPGQGNVRPAGVTWCADNGCFSKGYPGDQAWFAWLQHNAADASTCRFAVAPDVVADAYATLLRSSPWLDKIRALGYPAAYAAQDGHEFYTMPWDEFDVLFIGGTTEWKLGPHARRLVREANTRGVWVHMGRVNSEKRLRYAKFIGCDSADGTYLTRGPDKNLPRLLRYLRSVHMDSFDIEAVML
jgi:hypothetical protein